MKECIQTSVFNYKMNFQGVKEEDIRRTYFFITFLKEIIHNFCW